MFDKKRADRVINFIERLIVHVKGEWAGEPLKLERWEREDIIYPLFGTITKDGTRQYRTCYVEVPKKNGKSTLGAAIGLYLLLADGERGAEVYSAAGDREQARIIFDIASSMVNMSPKLKQYLQVYQYSIREKKYNGFYKVISADAKTKHGFNISGLIFDELHVQPNRELWDTLRQGTAARRQPLTIAFTTAGYDKESICYKVHDYAVKVRDGIIKDDTFLPVIYSVPMDADIYKEATWEEANPNYGNSVKKDFLKAEVNRIRNEPSFESTFRRLHLNQWVGTAETWISDEDWMACEGEVDYSGPCFAGLDLSAVSDLSAFVLIFPKDDKVSILPFLFVPEDNIEKRSLKDGINYNTWANDGYITATPGNIIDYDAIMQVMVEAYEKYDIQAIGYDRYLMDRLANKFSKADVDIEEWPFVPVGQGFISQSEPTKDLERWIKSKKIVHDGNPVMRWMLSNVAIETDPAGNIKISKKKAREKIDGIAALIDAIAVLNYQQEPEFRSRYEDDPHFDIL